MHNRTTANGTRQAKEKNTTLSRAKRLRVNVLKVKWRSVFVGFFLVTFAFYLVPLRVSAQQNPITIQVQAGYDGMFRIGDWFPVDVQVANDGPDVRGVLVWSFPGQPGEGVFERTIDLPRGARKRLTVYAYSRNFARNGLVQLRDGPNVLAEQDTRLEAADSNQLLLGVVSSDPTLLNSLNSLRTANALESSVRHLSSEAIPEQASALRGLNALFLHDLDTSTLSPGQRQALALWAQGGGTLIVSGGLDSARFSAGVAELLPVQIGGVTQGDLTPLVSLTAAASSVPVGGPTPVPQSAPPPTASTPGNAPINSVTLNVGAQPVTAPNTTDAPLLYRRPLGNGTVIFTTFDLAQLRGWEGEVPLWQNLLAPVDAAGVNNGRAFRSDLLQEVLRLPSLGLLPTRLLVVLLLVYVLAIGPLNYFVLRRLGRLEWAWLSVPLTVVLFAGGFYVVGSRLRGGISQLHQAAVVQAVEGQPRGVATAFIGLFSPRRASYNLGFQSDALINEARSWNDGFNDTAIVQTTDAGVRLPDLLVDVSSVRSLVAEAAVDSPVRVESALQVATNTVGGQIRNAGDTPLEDAILVRGEQYQQLGTLAPGASQNVNLNNTNFPWGLNLSQVGVFNRQEMLSNLFSNGGERQLLAEDGVYLLAWRTQPVIPAQLDGQEATQDGVTLYIVRLNG